MVVPQFGSFSNGVPRQLGMWAFWKYLGLLWAFWKYLGFCGCFENTLDVGVLKIQSAVSQVGND